MKIDANDVRVGNILEYQNGLWVVLNVSHTQPGKGGAYIQVRMKDIVDGTKSEVRFRSNESIEKAFLEQIEYQFLYTDGDALIFMHNADYSQISLQKEILGDNRVFLVEGMLVKIEFHNEKSINVILPENMEFVVESCDSAVKGQTATSSYKPAILENGVRIMVPPFIDVGDRVVVKIESREYLSRAK